MTKRSFHQMSNRLLDIITEPDHAITDRYTMDNEHTPLLSDEMIETAKNLEHRLHLREYCAINEANHWAGGIASGLRQARDRYEAHRAKDRELLQKLVEIGGAMRDHIVTTAVPNRGVAMRRQELAMLWDTAAKEHGITPADQ